MYLLTDYRRDKVTTMNGLSPNVEITCVELK
jgi:hypothetical protein